MKPDAASFDYITSMTALYTAAQFAFEKMTAPKSRRTQVRAGSAPTVNINIGGRATGECRVTG